jgi:hypothetical protein
MDSVYYLAAQPPARGWVDVAAMVAQLATPLLAIAIAIWVAVRQNEIQERQLRKDLFDRRFVVYRDTREFMAYVMGTNGHFSLQGTEYRRFMDAVENAEMLFRTDVHDYLLEIKKTADDLSVYANKEEAEAERTGDPELILKRDRLNHLFFVELPQRRTQVFRRDLYMGAAKSR